MISAKHEIKICERCATEFECKAGSPNQCQCSMVHLLATTKSFLEQAGFDCLCVNCLGKFNEKMRNLAGKTFPENNALEAGFHYYMEGQYFVFTENYHILRGYCCQSGCRHCPYGFNK
jgi:hypothetical protein